MKSKLINRRKKATTLVSPETLQMAVKKGQEIIPILQSKNDPRLAKLQKAVQWLSRVAKSPMGQTNLDDQAYPQYAQTVRQYVEWVSQLAGTFRDSNAMEQTEIPETVSQVASAGADPWVTDRDEKSEAKMPVKAEVPRLAAQKKTAQPGVPPGAPPPPAGAGGGAAAAPAPAPAAAAGAAPAPVKQAPPITQAGNGDINADIHQMSSETLANIISAISKNVEINDKAGLDFMESLAKQLKGRPVETQAPAGRAASVKDTLSLYDGNRTATGEMTQSEADSPEEWPIHHAIAQALGGKVKAFDVYQGPYILIGSEIRGEGVYAPAFPQAGTVRLWVQSEGDGGLLTVYNEENEKQSEPFAWDDTIAAVEAARSVLGEGGGEAEMENLCMASLRLAGIEGEPVGKVAVTPPDISEETAHEIKDEYPGEKDKAYATMWAIHNKKKKKGTLREVLADLHKEIDAYVLKTAAGSEGSSWFVEDQDTMDIKEGDKNVKEIAEAHGLEDEGPAKLERHETTLPITLNGSKNAAEEMKATKALKEVEKLSDRLKEMYLDAKEITNANDSRPVREAVEAIYRAYDQLGQAAKVLGKQQMQEEAEEDAVKVKEKASKKKGNWMDSLVLAAEDDDDEVKCEGCGKPHNNQNGGYLSELCRKCEKETEAEKKRTKFKDKQ
jgi:hypothetical protein